MVSLSLYSLTDGGTVQLDELLIKIRQLPVVRQQEVMDFVLFLGQQSKREREGHHSEWTDQSFQAMSIDQAMRGLEDEAELYNEDDLVEYWQ
ncbi:DUF2281 domain-containing protein [Marinobacter sp. S6332]|uniref:DUF2281 domain-containing protein n=1 Tax=Marinobacter sp. S6332 TaxID=2926403 RepID=UPI001FF23A31|nr:DUF2281 domain-containing protein [Marinobacter sp. S6332]MCK0164343.1 DUF2281 domain-containing protein [Marinobacter sp. S6332]